jgi:hemerythrin
MKTQDAQVSLLRLIQSVEAHFQHEERILKQVGYPGLAGHAARHRVLLERAREQTSSSTAASAASRPGIIELCSMSINTWS